MTFAGVLPQSSGADPALRVDVLGSCFAFVLPDHGEMTRHLQLLRDDAVFGESPSCGTEILTLVQGNVARAQSRQRHAGVSVELQHGDVVSMSDVACPLGVDVSCDRIKYLHRRDMQASLPSQSDSQLPGVLLPSCGRVSRSRRWATDRRWGEC